MLGLDFKNTVSQVSPSLGESEGPRSISNDTIEQLAATIQKLREIKIQRMQKVDISFSPDTIQILSFPFSHC